MSAGPQVPRWNELTAVFGGRFDPPHLGHVEAVKGLLLEPGFKKIVVLPSGSPAHKPAAASSLQRLEMARLAFESIDRVTVDPLEIERSGPSYTIDSLPVLKREYGPLAFIIGTDQLEGLHLWNRFPEILGLCHWIVLERRPIGLQAGKTLQKWAGAGFIRPLSEKLWVLESGCFLRIQPTPARALSSTLIRETIAKTGKPFESSLSHEILMYLKTRRIYGT